jgi:gliding motility-associated-like protein
MRILILISLALTASILNSQDYFSDRLFVKLKEEYKTTYVLEKDKSLRILLSPAELVSAKPVSAHPFLNSTYELIFDKNINLDSLILRLNRFPEIEFAEKVPLYKLFFTPNDPLYSTQWNLSKIQADLAWNLSQGCTQVKVAVTDDGFLMTHEDLVNQWHINTGEIAGNGIDDDGNGYIDDWRGWDAANNDNDPSATAPTNSFFTHGTHVAGIIAGQTHNSKGIAAIGYNCKMIPVKIGLSPNSSLTGAFQGLDYAINASGCDVVNMSWGGGGWSATYQTLFNIAQAKGIICVAAAGNSNTSTPMYPASYNHVISVAASASTDARASFSNFGSTIDVTAPGVGIPSCLAGATNAYGNLSGTSMASPLVAGLCALMKCYNPMPADSIEACLKRSCDNINAQNPSFIGQLGAGRINAFQALQYLTKKPKSDFIALDTFQCTGKSVRYAARSFGIPTLSYNWSFPGGSPASSTTANPVVSYTTNGYKTATLITCNSLGCDTITKTNLVYIDTPKASLIGRKYTSYNSNQVLITIKFTGNPPYSVTLTDGTNTWTQSNVKANPYFLSIVPKKDTSLISISTFSDSLCVGNRYGVDTIHRTNLSKDTTICVVLKTSNTGAIDGFGLSPTTSTNITWTFTNNENVVANWTAGGVPHFWRNILKFNLAGIPANAIINSASLSLYSKPNASHGWTGQPTAGTDNSTSISRITNAWTTSSISTSSWPSITTQNQVILAQSPSNNHSYLNIDVKNLVQDLITTNDFGLFLRHINTPYYNSLIYYSAEETDTSKHPKLVLCYTIPGGGSSSGGGNPQYCESSFKFNGTPTNTVVKIDPKNGAAWKDLYSTNGFTWECWFNLGNRTTVTGMESVVTASDAQLCEDIGFIFNMPWSGGTGFGWVVSGQTGCGAPKGVIATSMSFSPNTWYHAAGVMDYSTSTMRLYINGNQVNSGTLTIPMSQRMKNSVAVTIGNQDVNYNPYHTFTPFNGKIDEVRFWNTVRTASEIQANYKACLAANTSNLVAYFKADEGTGNNTVSVVNGNFVGTLQNSASWDTQVDSVKNCTLCSNSLCQDSTEINSAQTGWQALQTNGSWGSLTSCNYVTSLFTANAANFPGMTVGNCLWGPIVSNPSRTYYNSSSQTTTTTANADIAVFRKEITIPAGAIIDSVRLWMLSDDFVDSVLINSKNIYNTPIPITYGQVLYTKKDINVGSAVATNYVIIKAGDLGGNYGHYFRMKVYYSKVCGNSTSDCDTSGIVLCMSMDGNANDSTKFAHNGIVRGATLTTGRNGISNSAYYFDGTTSHISLGVKPMLKPNAASISLWVKPHTFNSYTGGNANCIFLTKNPNNPGSYMEAYSLYLTNRSGPTKFMTVSTHQPTTNEKWFQSVQNTNLNQWTHLVLTFDFDSLRLYINGQLDNKTYKGFNNVYDALDSIMIGYSANTMNKNYFKGDMDELKIYNRVLSNTEILNLYNKPFTCSCIAVKAPSDCDTTNLNTGKVLHLDFNGNTQDKSGNGNHAANFGATPVAGKGGVVNTAYKFNGTSNYMRVSNNATINSMTQITMCAILKPKGFYNGPCMNNQIISKNNINNSGHYSLVYSPLNDNGACSALQDSNKCNFYSGISSGGCSVSAVYKAPFIKKDSWYCVVTTYDGDTAKNYVNGELRFTCKINLPLGSNSADLFIGKLDNITYPYWLNADLDDIRIYNRTLAPSEVKGYCSACSVSQPPPCDTSRRFTYTQCLNDSIQVVLRPGSQYQWSPSIGLSSDTMRNPKIYLSANRTYLVSYLGLRGCQLIDTIDILVKPAAIYPKIEDQLICIGDSIQIEIPIYATNILWSPNLAISSTTAKNPYFFPTANRTYYLEFRDSFGCIQKDTFDINTKLCCPARAQFTIPEDMLCYGENLTITNRSKGPITSYNWSFGNAIPSSHAGAAPPVLNFPNGGTYSLRLIVTNGSCQDTMEKTITVVQIMPNAGKDTFNCLGAFTVQLGESAISDWSYSWTPSKFLNDPNIANPICNIVNDSVNYILEITDRSSGCMAYDTVVVYTNRNIVSKTTKQRICFGDSVLFNNNYSKTTNLYYYTIKKTDGICDSFIDILDLNVLQKQVLTYTPKIHCEFYIDGKGKRHDTSYIEQDTIRSKSLLNCDSIINITPREIFKKIYTEKTVQGCSPFLYNGKTYITSKVKEDSIRIRGAYSGCDSIIEYINVIVYPKPKAEISPSIPNPVLYKQTVTLTASGGSGYLWLQMGSTNSEIDYKLNQIQPRLFTVRVTDDNNCWDTVSYIVNGELPDTCYYGFPNAFTPNQDGLNDEYIPNMDECTEIKVFAIYDRWGEKVFETNQQKGWNGFYKGKPAPLSVYLYYAELITPWGIKIHKGNFTLIR